MSLLTNPWFYAVAIPAVITQGISKSGFAGIGLLALPLVSLVISPSQAAAILLPLLIVMDVMGWFTFKGRGDVANLKIILPAGVLGVVIGTLTFKYVNDAWLRLMVGLIAVVFVLQRLHGQHTQAAATKPSIIKGGICGMLAGYTSFIANAGGPPMQLYLVPQQMPKVLFVGTTVLFFSLMNLIKLPPFFALGLFNLDNFLVSLVLLPIAPLGYWIGLKLLSKVNQASFYNIITIAAALTGGKLVWDGLRGLGYV